MLDGDASGGFEGGARTGGSNGKVGLKMDLSPLAAYVPTQDRSQGGPPEALRGGRWRLAPEGC